MKKRPSDIPQNPADRAPTTATRRRPEPLDTARGVATQVLHRVMVDSAFASRTLDYELERTQLDDRDARLATEIVYGTLRVLPELDRELDRHLSRGRPDPFTLSALRAAAYQARCLARVPDHAIVQETVALVKQKRGEGLGKLTNAVLRRVVENRPKEPTPPERVIAPEWVERVLSRGLGESRIARALALDGRSPPICLRVAGDHDIAAFSEQLHAALPHAQITRGEFAPRCLVLRGAGDPRRLPGHEQGAFSVQDEGAQLIALLADAKPGERVLDACAGHGGKTLCLVDAVGPSGHVTAVDLHQAKLDQLTRELQRLHVPLERVDRDTIDLSVGDGGLQPVFDRVLVDAPCTGLGTLARRPELLLRLKPQDPERMASLQLRILGKTAKLVKPGGMLIYAVCSGSHEEALGVSEKLEKQMPNLLRVREPVSGVAVTPDDDGVFRLGPWLGAQANLTDVYQIVRWQVLDSHRGAV